MTSTPIATGQDALAHSAMVEVSPIEEPRAEEPVVVESRPLPLGQRTANVVVILLPLVGLIWAMAYSWGWGLTGVELSIFAVMYLLTGLGVTIGYHRYFTHKSFKTGRVMTAVLGVLGCMSVEGSIIHWVASHRCHHQHSDTHEDPHSPHSHGAGFFNIAKGFWHAHIGWLFEPIPHDLDKYVPDLKSDKLVSTISRLFPLWALLSLLIPAAAGGLITMSWTGAFLAFLWGGLVRILLVHHVTWSVNSICHIWGTRPYRSHDESRNNPIVGVLALGEGWHNNHHAFPTSARHGLRWWQLDVSYLIIRGLERVGLVWDVKVPDAERMASKRNTPEDSPRRAA